MRAGSRPAGERLPGQHALAQRFAVSRTTIRAALAELTGRGPITPRTGKGSYVLWDGRPPDDGAPTGSRPSPDLLPIRTHAPDPTGYASREPARAPARPGGPYHRRYLGICHGDTRTRRPADTCPAGTGRTGRERRGPGRPGHPRAQ
ncbi:GntR family transcriptional regulator [Streptomyces sp. NPDC053076]|uniref:GntR family transcriptional regulator n=1 Tax=Streptomyces sp. NPDC053076 TaxID=3365696 RepID=UPI0037D417A5